MQQQGHTEILKLLLNDKRVDINKANEHGRTPLFQIVCKREQFEIVKLLLNDGRVIDVNKADNYYLTPFYLACSSGYFEIVEYILAQRKEVNSRAKDSQGRTALDVARENGKSMLEYWYIETWSLEEKKENEKIIELLESFENNPNETRTTLRMKLGLTSIFF